jgi:probable rRNA maturation factor
MGRKQIHSVHFYFEKVGLTLKERGKLKVFINRLIAKERKSLNNLNYIFCNDNALLKINQKYLDHNFYTDVITFDLSSSRKEILADIYISVDRIRENAKILKLSLKEELHRVMLHGLLHLCGYNDKTEGERKLIRKKEDFYLNLYFERST